MSEVETSTTACSEDCTLSVWLYAHRKKMALLLYRTEGQLQPAETQLSDFHWGAKLGSLSACSDKYGTQAGGDFWLMLATSGHGLGYAVDETNSCSMFHHGRQWSSCKQTMSFCLTFTELWFCMTLKNGTQQLQFPTGKWEAFTKATNSLPGGITASLIIALLSQR